MTRLLSALYLFTISIFCSGVVQFSKINGVTGFAQAVEEGQVCVGGEGEEQICKGDHDEKAKLLTQDFDYDDDDDDDDDAYQEENDEFDRIVADDMEETCKDAHKDCEFWAGQGECEKNPKYMLVSCRRSCDACERITIVEGSGKFGQMQEIERNHPKREEIQKIIDETEVYMNEISSDPKFEEIRDKCLNRHSQCALWVTQGECKANPAYMTINCAPSCKSCDQIDINTRCPKDDTLVDIFQPGDLNKMYERIAQDESLNVTVLSRPDEDSDDFHPWVITIDDFVSEAECDRLKILGAEEGYERSTDVGDKKFDGTFESKKSSGRTSYNAWCSNKCYDDPVTVNVMTKIANLTGIPVVNSEHLQLLRYQEGQFYRTHHDYIEAHTERNPGPRVLTAYLYLNDVEAGGGTNFPQLDITVMPKRGRLLLWPSVLDEDPNKKDYSTTHQALPVEAGEKYGANGWLHLRNFVDSLGKGCI